MNTSKRHTDREYEAELAKVRDNLLLMAGRVEAMIASSVRSFVEQDAERARATITQDAVVNQLEVDTDDLCLRILAKRQPVASDLRFITLALKMVTDLERIGDLAVDICERALALAGSPRLAAYTEISQMATVAQGMVRDAIDAFVNSDETKARQVMEDDEQLDTAYQDVCGDVLGVMQQDRGKIHRGIHVQSVAKFLERIGDHATNIAEQVVFMVKGKDVRHVGKLPERH